MIDRRVKIVDLDDKLNQIKIRDIIVIYLFSIFIISGLIFVFIKLTHKEIGDFVLNTLSLILQSLILIILLLKIRPSKSNIVSLYKDFKEKIKKREILEVTLIRICIAIGGSKLIINFIYYINPSIINNFICDSGKLINSIQNYLVNMILLVVVSPVTEEIIFRSVIFRRLIRRFNIYAGIIVSSIVFASLYAGSGIAGALALGVVNCILYIKYKNILIPICVNILNNIIVLIYILPLINKNIEDMIVTSNDILLNGLLGSALCIIGGVMMIKFINKNRVVLNKYNKLVKEDKDWRQLNSRK